MNDKINSEKVTPTTQGAPIGAGIVYADKNKATTVTPLASPLSAVPQTTPATHKV